MNAFCKATLVAILFCVVGHVVHGEPDYVLPGGPPPTSETVLLTNPGKPLQPPTILTQVPFSSIGSQRSRSKIVESYLSPDFMVFGGEHTTYAKPFQYRLSHPNSLQRGPEPKPFEVVRAPVIYHQTVTDTDVTKALADAFNVVDKLRKPGNKIKALPQDDLTSGITSIEFVNHPYPENSQGRTATTTTTIVEAPQQLNAVQQNQHHHHRNHQSQAVTFGQLTLVSSPYHVQTQDLPPVPAAADLPPAPPQTNSVISTSAPVVAEVVPVLPATTTSTSPSPGIPPKLIIPSQPHVTTLAEAVHTSDPQIRTIIQPVYIPYPVDQNGRPFGPLPDYQSMDFRLLLSAQKQILAAATRQPPPPRVQIVEAQPTVEASQPTQQHPLQQEYYIQQVDQSLVTAQDPSGSVQAQPSSPLPTRTRKRIARRRNKQARRTTE